MIVDLAEYKLKNSEHLEGTGVCLHCKHEWEAIVPTGVVCIQCPQCGLHRGVLKGCCSPEWMWECMCGCRFFFLTTEKAICANCGHAKLFGDIQ